MSLVGSFVGGLGKKKDDKGGDAATEEEKKGEAGKDEGKGGDDSKSRYIHYNLLDSNFDLLIYSEVGTMKPGDYMIHVSCSLN